MKKKILPVPLKDIVKKPEFSDIYGLREYVLSILDESEKRNSLDFQGFFKKERKKTLSLGWKERGLERRLVIKDFKDREKVDIGIELKCLNTDKGYIVEQYGILQQKSKNQTKDRLRLTYINNLKDNGKITSLYSKKTRTGVLRIKRLLSRAINHNYI